MKSFNLLKMEIYKNLNDTVNLFLIGLFMILNLIGGTSLRMQFFSGNYNWGPLSMLFIFSFLGSIIFLFVYPYQLARVDYKHKVMSMTIASGVTRIQYYFVKIGATLLFSLLSFICMILLPLIFVGGIDFALVDFQIDVATLGDILFILISYLSSFFILMTAVILVRGRGSTIFVFLGLSWISSFIMSIILNPIFNIGNLSTLEQINRVGITNNIITIILFGLLGVFLIRKQNL